MPGVTPTPGLHSLLPPAYLRLFRRPSFWIAVSLFALHRTWEFLGAPPLWMAAYLDPLLALPLSLSLVLFIQRRWVYRDPNYRLGLAHVLFSVVLFSLVFEWWLPPQDARMTADLWDVGGYTLGGLWFLFDMNR